MTLEEFIGKYTGKPVDYDKAYGAQCFDLARQYFDDVWGIPQPAATGERGAKALWGDITLNRWAERIPNTPAGVPGPGDVVIWDGTPGNPYGHVAIGIDGNATGFRSFDQNFPAGTPPHVQWHGYRDVLGWYQRMSNEGHSCKGAKG
jgi:N-acetylmuramoyl-L-alanine amidase